MIDIKKIDIAIEKFEPLLADSINENVILSGSFLLQIITNITYKNYDIDLYCTLNSALNCLEFTGSILSYYAVAKVCNKFFSAKITNNFVMWFSK